MSMDSVAVPGVTSPAARPPAAGSAGLTTSAAGPAASGASALPGNGALVDGPLEVSRAGVLAGAFKALGDPVRLRLLSMIASAAEGEICVCDLSAAFALTGPTISHHLRILREAGLVDCSRRGTWVYYRLVPATLALLAGLLDSSRRPAARSPRGQGRMSRQPDC